MAELLRFEFYVQQRIVLPLPPSANRYWRRAGHRLHRSAEASDYIAQVYWLMRGADVQFDSANNMVIVADMYMTRGDLDNRVKVLLDALSGVLYADDAQVSELHIVRRRCKRADERVEILIVEQA